MRHLKMGIYDNINDQDVKGELNLWRAWLILHITDFLCPEDISIYNSAKSVLFSQNHLFKQVCDWVNVDMHLFRRKLIELKRFHNSETKKSNSKYSKNKVQKLIKNFSDKLLYA